jgi:hypothetical protein
MDLLTFQDAKRKRILEMPHMDGPNIETLATDGNMTIADIIAMLGMLDENEEGIPTDEVAISVSGDVGSMPEGLQALLGGLMGEEETSDPLRLAKQAEQEAKQSDMYGNEIPVDALDSQPLMSALLSQESKPLPLSTPATLLKRMID